LEDYGSELGWLGGDELITAGEGFWMSKVVGVLVWIF
jgi:hypothetical protein